MSGLSITFKRAKSTLGHICQRCVRTRGDRRDNELAPPPARLNHHGNFGTRRNITQCERTVRRCRGFHQRVARNQIGRAIKSRVSYRYSIRERRYRSGGNVNQNIGKRVGSVRRIDGAANGSSAPIGARYLHATSCACTRAALRVGSRTGDEKKNEKSGWWRRPKAKGGTPGRD